jgi:hypothetical protein
MTLAITASVAIAMARYAVQRGRGRSIPRPAVDAAMAIAVINKFLIAVLEVRPRLPVTLGMPHSRDREAPIDSA